MPIYEYECAKCKRRLEQMQKMSDPPLTECPHCGGALERLISPAGFQLKGSGWYKTDYAAKPRDKDREAAGSEGKDQKAETKEQKKD